MELNKDKDKELDKEYIKNNIIKLGKKYDTRTVFEDFVTCCALALANSTQFNQNREDQYLKIVKKYEKEELATFPQMMTILANELEKEDSEDILGNIYEDLGFYSKDRSQFFTPIPICNLMSMLTINKETAKNQLKNKGYVSISDPCCGSGRLLFASLKVYRDADIDIDDIFIEGSDVSNICCYMTYVNLSLMGASAIVQNKDSLTNKLYDTYFTPALACNKELMDKLLKDGVLVKKDKNQAKGEEYEQ